MSKPEQKDAPEGARAERNGKLGGDGYRERAAARRYAERRRLGPWRADPARRSGRRDRDIAAMARAGFPVRLAISVIDGTDEDDDS